MPDICTRSLAPSTVKVWPAANAIFRAMLSSPTTALVASMPPESLMAFPVSE